MMIMKDQGRRLAGDAPGIRVTAAGNTGWHAVLAEPAVHVDDPQPTQARSPRKRPRASASAQA
jgi:hypothetical protein